MSVKKHSDFFKHDGVSQGQRILDSLDPLYAKIDDREEKDLLAFLWKISEYIQFYGINGNVSGDWQDFFGVEKSVVLSLIATTDTTLMEREFLRLYSDTSETSSKNEYLPIFDLLYEFTGNLKDLYERTSHIAEVNLILSSRNKTALESFIENTLDLYVGYTGGGDNRFIFKFKELAAEMGLTVSPDESPVVFTSLAVDNLNSKMKVETYGLHQDLQKLFNTAVYHGDLLLEKEHKRKGDYTPHIGLLLSFMKLFNEYQSQLNGLTEKHLHYYYQDVLGIEYRDKSVDSAYLIFELAKNIESSVVKEGTPFKAGKDSESNQMFYESDDEIVVNNSEASLFKSLYSYNELEDNGVLSLLTDKNGVPVTASGTQLSSRTLRAAVKADTKDGKKEKLDEDNPQFYPFGNSSIDYADLGFAVSSPILRMSGGDRTVTVKFTLEQSENGTNLISLLKESDITDIFDIEVTCEKKWVNVNSNINQNADLYEKFKKLIPKILSDTINETDKALEEEKSGEEWLFQFSLDSSFPAVTDFSSDIHDGNFTQSEPVCRFVLKKYGAGSYYEILRRINITSCDIFIECNKVEDLVLQSGLGVFKNDKPVMPFGVQPMKNSEFYIGSSEILSKKIDTLTVKWDWIDYPLNFAGWYTNYDSPAEPDVQIERIIDKQWTSLYDSSNGLLNFSLSGGEFKCTGQNGVSGAFIDLGHQKTYTLDCRDGFVRFKLNDNGFLFGHKNYPKALIGSLNASYTAVTDKGVTTTTMNQATVINPPITPLAENVTLNYTSSVSSLEKTDFSFYYLHPFGVSKENIPLLDSEPKLNLVLPVDDEAYFYIGLSDVSVPQSISILFLFIEGTGDLGKSMPDEVKWDYLSKDSWVEFDEQGIVKDGTLDFAGSGIITFAMPDDAVDDNTIMDDGFYWIRGRVSENSRAVNMLSSVLAQAVKVTLDDQDYASDHYGTPLPKETISKLKESNTEIKTVLQPAASFNGRQKEDSESYRVRVSERLRHKDRAVSLWDYEHLVLEAFPEIYKVNCLNHFNSVSDIAPGHVRIIVIPQLENLSAVNILKPAVSIIKRKEIKEYLVKRCSEMVCLEVENPRYDELEVTADVVFHKSYDKGYYNKQLSLDISDYLTPWKSDTSKISFLEKLHSSSILNFIEEREYVDYLTKFEVKKINSATNEAAVVLGDIEQSFGDSIFVSAEKHLINKIV